MASGPRALVIVTGSELVRGDRPDENGPFLARELSARGVRPDRVVIVGDRPEGLAEALRQGLETDLCIVSGGLGPTHDDRTAESLAEATGKSLVVHPELEAEIEAFSRGIAERLGRLAHRGVALQAALHLRGVDVLRARLDQPRLGADERDRPVLLAAAQIAGVVPASLHSLGGGLRLVPVARVHDIGQPRTDDHLAGFVRSHVVIVVVHHAHLVLR